MNEIGREIFKNVYSTMKERHYSWVLPLSNKAVAEICIIDNSDPNLCIYIASKKFNRLTKTSIGSAEALLTGKVVKDAILEIFMPVVSLGNEENGTSFVVSAYAAVKYSSTFHFGFSPLIGGTLLMKITSGLDNSIGLCTEPGSSKIVLLSNVQEILYKKEDILEYLL